MLTPGFITDILGFLLLIPLTRAAVPGAARRRGSSRAATAAFFTVAPGPAAPGSSAPSAPAGTVQDTAGWDDATTNGRRAARARPDDRRATDGAAAGRGHRPDPARRRRRARGVHAPPQPQVRLRRRRLRVPRRRGRPRRPPRRPRADLRGPLRRRRVRAASASHDGGLAFWVAAIRESFEEAGVLLAYGTRRRSRRPRRSRRRRPAGPSTAGGRRRRARLVDVCAGEGLRLAVDGMHYFSHWITPRGRAPPLRHPLLPGRAPPGQTPLHDDREVIANAGSARPTPSPAPGRRVRR